MSRHVVRSDSRGGDLPDAEFTLVDLSGGSGPKSGSMMMLAPEPVNCKSTCSAWPLVANGLDAGR